MMEFIIGVMLASASIFIVTGLYMEAHKRRVYHSRPRWEDIARK